MASRLEEVVTQLAPNPLWEELMVELQAGYLYRSSHKMGDGNPLDTAYREGERAIVTLLTNLTYRDDEWLKRRKLKA